MTGDAISRVMEDGNRLHLQHGPIDIIAQAFGKSSEILAAYKQGSHFFETVLQDLVRDLDDLKKPVDKLVKPELGPIAATMWQAAAKFSEGQFVTSMAAVAGAVADAVCAAMLKGRNLDKVYVNNGGDIALYLKGDAKFVGGIVNNQDLPSVGAEFELVSHDGVGGIATSGWRGRSLSAGIADAVTVLANTAAVADVAATIIAGDVIIRHASIVQVPAKNLRDDTDLGHMLVTEFVGELDVTSRNLALENGLKTARKLHAAGLIKGAYLSLQGEFRSLSSTANFLQGKVA